MHGKGKFRRQIANPAHVRISVARCTAGRISGQRTSVKTAAARDEKLRKSTSQPLIRAAVEPAPFFSG
jgi:hypothetical protein